MPRLAQSPSMRPLSSSEAKATLPAPPFRVTTPVDPCSPILVSSPHSGRTYPAEFIAASRLPYNALRRSEDSFVDELFGGAADAGIPTLLADFPRAYCDVNREPWELDPVMFTDKLPPWCNTSSARVVAGFGTIARLVSSGEPIYRNKLTFADAERRIRTCWHSYHGALTDLIDKTLARHGTCLLLDGHSMPSLGWTETATGDKHAVQKSSEPDFVLGDAFGTSCAQSITQFTERFLREHGLHVRRNDPYAGGYVTRHYGRPASNVHVLQIEISRSLYMDEARFEKLASFSDMRVVLTSLLEGLAASLPALITI